MNDLKESKFIIIWRLIKQFHLILLMQIIITTIWSIYIVLNPYLIKNILDTIIKIKPYEVYIQLTNPIAKYIAISSVLLIFFRLSDYFTIKFNYLVKKKIGYGLLYIFLNEENTQFIKLNSGFLANKFDNIFENIVIFFKLMIDQVFGHFLCLIFSIFAVWNLIDIQLAQLLIFWMLIYMYLSYLILAKADFFVMKTVEKKSELIGSITDTLSNLLEISFLNMKKKEIKLFGNFLELYVNSMKKRDFFFLILNLVQSILFIVYQAVCLYILVEGYFNGTITAGDFVMVFMLNLAIIDNLKSLSLNWMNIVESYGAIRESISTLKKYINTKIKNYVKYDNIRHGNLYFKNVEFKYTNSSKRFYFDKIKILKGEKVAIVGESGSGKSTFVNLILKMFEPLNGEIYIDEIPLSKISINSVRKNVSYISQSPILFNRSIYENILCANYQANFDDIVYVSKISQAHSFIMKKENNYDYNVGIKGNNLSGGERQRIILSRNLLTNHKIVIFDEFTNQLDSITEKNIFNYIKQYFQHKTVLIVTHNLNTIKYVDKVILLENGKITSFGTHNELLKKSSQYRKLVESTHETF